jgi:hypothetical protein
MCDSLYVCTVRRIFTYIYIYIYIYKYDPSIRLQIFVKRTEPGVQSELRPEFNISEYCFSHVAWPKLPSSRARQRSRASSNIHFERPCYCEQARAAISSAQRPRKLRKVRKLRSTQGAVSDERKYMYIYIYIYPTRDLNISALSLRIHV